MFQNYLVVHIYQSSRDRWIIRDLYWIQGLHTVAKSRDFESIYVAIDILLNAIILLNLNILNVRGGLSRT